MSDTFIRVLLIGKECLVRAGLRKVIESWPECTVIGEIANNQEALDVFKTQSVDIILMSVAHDSIEDISELLDIDGNSRVIALSGDTVPSLAQHLVSLGVRGVVNTKKTPDELRRAIQKVHTDNEIWLDRASLSALVRSGRTRRDVLLAFQSLSYRERQVVDLVCKGFTNKEIGEHLFIAETTVRHHLTTIFSKIEVRNRFELISFIHGNRHLISNDTRLPKSYSESGTRDGRL